MTSFPSKSFHHLLLAIVLVSPVFAAGNPAPHVSVFVDATETPRKIFHARMTIPAKPGSLTLYYPNGFPASTGQPARSKTLPG